MTTEHDLRHDCSGSASTNPSACFDSSQRIAEIIDSMIDSRWDLDLTSGRICFSPGFHSMLGYESRDFAPDFETFQSMVHPEDLPQVTRSFRRHLEDSKRQFEQEFRLRSKTGDYLWILSRGTIIDRDKSGRPTRVVGIHIDITERRLLEQGIRESEAAYRAMFEENPFGVVLNRMNGEYYDVNERFALSLGMHRQDIIGKTPEQLGLVPVGTSQAIVDALAAKRVLEGYHMRARNGPDGEMLDLLITASKISVAGESMVLSIINDVTRLVRAEAERSIAEEKLKQSEITLRTVLDTIPVRVFWKDANLRYLGCNQAFARDAGFESTEHLLGKDDYQMGWREQAELYRVDDQQVLNTGTAKASYEEPQTTATGETIWLRTTKTPMRDSGGRITGVLGTYEDITETKRMEERLAKAEKMQAIGLLAGGVAHDLNNMLGPLVGYPALILHQLPADSPLVGTVKRMERAALDSTEIIEDLLTLARRGRYEMKPTSLNQVVTEYLDSTHYMRISSENPAITVTTRLSGTVPQITGSGVHLRKLIMNVVGNAFEAISQSGEIVITTKRVELSHLKSGFAEVVPGAYAVLSIKDSGHGIAVEDRQKIFEPYFSRKCMGKSGSGLGLAVVWGVIKDHGGYYDLFSDVGQGTEFVFYFPAEASTTDTDGAESAAKCNKTVLIVDDSAIARQQTEQMVQQLGYSAESVANGREALRYLSQRTVDLVMLEMLMEPDFDGLDTYREILRIHPDQKAIVVSGYSETDRVQQLMQMGARALIRKPYTMERLSNVLHEVIGMPSAAPAS